jgi:5-methylcytosine-specific restriction endonuclease McrA
MIRYIFEFIFGKTAVNTINNLMGYNTPQRITGTRRTRKPIISNVGTSTKSTTTTPTASNTSTTSKSKAIPSDVRDQVWLNYHGASTTGTCYCCGKSIEKYRAGWHCSHVIARDRGGENIVSNLRPCCSGCNLSMGNANMYLYIQENKLQGAGAKNVIRYKREHPEQFVTGRSNGK